MAKTLPCQNSFFNAGHAKQMFKSKPARPAIHLVQEEWRREADLDTLAPELLDGLGL